MTHPNNTTEEGPRYVDAIDVLFASGALKHLNKRQTNVLFWIARRAHRDTRSAKFWTCWGFQEKIAQECGLAVRTVKRAQADLVEMGLIDRRLTRYGQGKRGYYYKLASEDQLFHFGENGQPIRGKSPDRAALERFDAAKSGDNHVTFAGGQGDHLDQVTRLSPSPNGRGQGDHLHGGQGCHPKRVVESEYQNGKGKAGKFSEAHSENGTNGNGHSPDDIWQRALAELQLQLPESTFETWVRDTSLIDCAGDSLIVGAPNAYARDWLQNRLRAKCNRILNQMTKRTVTVDFEVRPFM